MTANNDTDNAGPDFEPIEGEADFSDFDQGKSNSLGDLWRNNTMVKMGVVVLGVGAVIAALMLFGGNTIDNPSTLNQTPELKEAPGAAELSPEMKEAMQTFDTQKAEEAAKNNTSAIPTILEPPKEQVVSQQDELSEEDPFTRWRKVQEERERLQSEQQMGMADLQVQQQQQQQVEQNRNERLDALSKGMQEQMQAILESRAIKKMNYMTVVDIKAFRDAQAAAQQALLEQQQAAVEADTGFGTDGTGTMDMIPPPAIPAATVNYAQLLIEANTDAPGPVLAQLASGPLAGGRLLGKFEETDNYLVLKFDRVIHKGKTYKTDAIALDPSTTLPGLITEKDRRLFSRVFLPAAASFIAGVAGSAAESGGTETSVSTGTSTITASEERDPDLENNLFKGVEKGAEKISEIMDEDSENIKPMLRVATGTPMGILFIEPAIEESAQMAAQEEDDDENKGINLQGYVPAGYGIPSLIPFVSSNAGNTTNTTNTTTSSPATTSTTDTPKK